MPSDLFKSFLEKIQHKNGPSKDIHEHEYPSYKIDNYFLPKSGIFNSIANFSPAPGPEPFVNNVHTCVIHALQYGTIDYEMLLKYCHDIESSHLASLEAAKELREELKSGFAARKIVAMSLLVTMVNHLKEHFLEDISKSKFTKVLQGILDDEQTSTYVRKFEVRVLGILTHEANSKPALEPYKELYAQYKSSEDPPEGITVSDHDEVFYPQLHCIKEGSKGKGPREIHELNALNSHINIAKGNADLLSQAVANTTDEDWKGNDLLQEFHDRTMMSQQMLEANIPWLKRECDKEVVNTNHVISNEDTTLPPQIQAYQRIKEVLGSISLVLHAYQERIHGLETN